MNRKPKPTGVYSSKKHSQQESSIQKIVKPQLRQRLDLYLEGGRIFVIVLKTLLTTIWQFCLTFGSVVEETFRVIFSIYSASNLFLNAVLLLVFLFILIIMRKPSSKEVGSIFTADDDAKDFLTYLREANSTDLTDIQHSGCVSEGRDLRDVPMIVMIPSLGLNRIDKPEVLFRKMLLLFIKKANEIVGKEYSVVYAHTNIDIMNQYPLIYKFYSVLPRSFKKNLQRMYIIHPNIGIRMFFEFARVFLSQKFYQKLCLVESVLDFQRIVPPTQLALPLKFLYKEDEDHEIKYRGTLASLSASFDPALGTTKIIDVCTHFLRENQFHKQQGIFRIPGDEGELNLARVRLQYANMDGFTSSGRIEIAANRRSIIIGDFDALFKKRSGEASAIDNNSQNSPVHSNHHHHHHHQKKPSKSEMETSPEEVSIPMSVVVLTNPNTIAQILKMAIRDLPESLIPDDVYRDLIDITRMFDMNNLPREWDLAVAKRLSVLPLENFSTFVHIVSFLREVAKESKTNNMDASNLATVFGPTIFRSSMDDPIKAVMELKVSHTILYNVIVRDSILLKAMKLFKEQYKDNRVIVNNPVFARLSSTSSSSSFSAASVEHLSELDYLDLNEKEEIVDLTSSINPSVLSRMLRGRDHHHSSSSNSNRRSNSNTHHLPNNTDNNEEEEGDRKMRADEEIEEEEEEQGSNRQQPPSLLELDQVEAGEESGEIALGAETIEDEDSLLVDSTPQNKKYPLPPTPPTRPFSLQKTMTRDTATDSDDEV